MLLPKKSKDPLAAAIDRASTKYAIVQGTTKTLDSILTFISKLNPIERAFIWLWLYTRFTGKFVSKYDVLEDIEAGRLPFWRWI